VRAGVTVDDDQRVAGADRGGVSAAGRGYALVVINGDASPHTATITTPGTKNGLAVADATLVVAAGDTGLIALTNDFRGANDRAAVTYDAVTSVTVAVIKLGA
jgi:hypothetical protein